MEQIRRYEVRPPRQLNAEVPRELDRICLKAMAPRASERYSTAGDMAEDLRAWLAASAGTRSTAPPGVYVTPAEVPLLSPAPSARTHSFSARVVPRGLRAFGADDADFFLKLLPGPHDRDDLPDSVSFWKRGWSKRTRNRPSPSACCLAPAAAVSRRCCVPGSFPGWRRMSSLFTWKPRLATPKRGWRGGWGSSARDYPVGLRCRKP